MEKICINIFRVKHFALKVITSFVMRDIRYTSDGLSFTWHYFKAS